MLLNRYLFKQRSSILPVLYYRGQSLTSGLLAKSSAFSPVESRQGCESQRRALAGPDFLPIFSTLAFLPSHPQLTPQWRQHSDLVVRPCGLPLQFQLSMPEPLPSMACDAILHRKLKYGSSHSLNRGPN